MGLEKTCEVLARKEEDLSTRPVKVGKEGILVYTYVQIEEDKALFSTGLNRGDAEHDWGVSQGSAADGGTWDGGSGQVAVRSR